MPPLVLAALGAAGIYAAYRWFTGARDEEQPEVTNEEPVFERLVKDPQTGIYLPEQRKPPEN